jgi:serine/threonine protein kinase
MKKQLFAGKFEIQGEIAKGQTGTIYYGYDMELRQEVAIKVYHSHINGRLIRGKAFIEKSKPLLLIDHPNLIKIFKVEEEDDTPVVFMEFFDAPSLQQMIHDKSPLPLQDMLILAREIAEVLVHTHFQGIIHGTLHPGHVLVGPQGQIKVMDLGLSWILMDILSNCDGELLRPLPYLPPEIAKGELLNVSSDLYCLGFMMYEMLTGSVPYAGLPKTSIMGKLAFDQTDPVFDFPGTVPEAICDLIRHMTRNKIQQRLQDTTHVLTIINQQLAKLPLSEESTFSPPKPPQPQPPPPKEPTQHEKTPATTAPSTTTPEPTLKKTPAFQRPHTSINDDRVYYTKMLRKIGITLGLLSLIGVAGTLGYWYRDQLEPDISVFQSQPENPSQETQLQQVTHPEPEFSIVPAQNSLNIQQPPLETDELLNHKPEPLNTPQATPVDPQSGSPLLPQESDLKSDQSSSTQTPNAKEIEKEKSLAPTKKHTESNQAPSPIEKQPSEIKPIVSGITLAPTTKVPEKEPLQHLPSLDPNQKAIDQETKPAPSAISSKDRNQEPTDEEIEELLQSLDAPAIDLSSITEP